MTINFDSTPHLRVIVRDDPDHAGVSRFEVTGDYDAVLQQVASIMNDESVQAAQFDAAPKRAWEYQERAIYRSCGLATFWPAKRAP